MFQPGREIRRREIHERFGGSWQSGISPSAAFPLVFMFTGKSGEAYGYRDYVDSAGVFHYYGEGRKGDMPFRAGNLAVRDHALNGKDLHLFEQSTTRSHVRYVGQMVCAGYDLVPDVQDVNGATRTAIVFRLIPMQSIATTQGEQVGAEWSDQSPLQLWDAPLTELRARAEEQPVHGGSTQQVLRNVYRRSVAVRVYVLRRADGMCEGCTHKAPFMTVDGRPYLEPHHTRRISDGGPDHPAHVIALCPACHRRAHYAADSKDFNNSLIQKLTSLETA